MPSDAPILHVGDKVEVGTYGLREIQRIDVCLRPSTDPAAEQHYARVDSIELGEHGPPFVVGIEGGGWAYGIEVFAESIEKGAKHEG